MARRSAPARGMSAAGSATAVPAKPLFKSKSSKKSGAWAEPTPAQIQRSIQDSLLPVEISLEITLDSTSAVDTPTPRLPLLECSVNSWQELVELQRVVERLQRPTRPSRDSSSDKVEDTLEGMVFGSPSKPELQLSPTAVNSVHKFATTLQLRLQSLGLSVRSLLKDRVLVRLHPDSAATNTRKIVPWHAVVVSPVQLPTASDSPAEWLQRIILPRVRTELDPLARLRHPQLVSMVDAMLEDHAQSGRIHVVVLRGIPGSGKSSLGREVVAICEARRAKTIVCSADVYFETPRGYHFDVKGISKAHELSQRTFREALAGREVAVVVVDNTHTQRWEYEPYEQGAAEQGAQFHVLEMHCPDVLTCSRMAQRNSHGVSVAKVQSMYLRWEADDRAIKFDPQFQDPLVLVNPVTRNPLNLYVAYVGLFIDAHTRNEILARVGPRHGNVVAEHITLFFRPTTQYIRQAPIGRKFKVRVVSVVEDSKGQALQIELDDRLPLKCRNKIPHVTVSTAEGVSAFYSNELLEDPRATRTPVVDAWDFEATLGIALMVQNRKLVSLASPFHHQFKQPAAPGDSTEDMASSASPPIDSLVVLDVDASELVQSGPNDFIERILLRHELVRHCSGAQVTTHRVVVVRNVEEVGTTSETQLIAAVHRWLSPAWISHALHFDTVLFTKKGETLASKLKMIRQSATRVTVLTTQRSLLMANESISSEGVLSFQRLPCLDGEDPLSRLAPALDASLTRAMDAMGVGPTEEACFIVQKAIEIAERALLMCGIHGTSVGRVDAALWTHPSSTVEIATTVAVDCCIEDVVAALQSCGPVNVAAMGAEECRVSVQFQLPTPATQTPTIRWLVSHASDCAKRVGDVQRRLRDALTYEQQELYPRVACVIEAVLGVNGTLTMAASPATLRLLTERVVLAFFTSAVSPEPLSMGGKPVDHHVMWTHIVSCLCFLASWDHDRWKLELDVVIRMVSPSGVADEMAKKISEAMQTAASKVATNDDDLSEMTGAPSWGRKLAAILSTPPVAQR
jgi:tRNA uridine 5-carbamoylmethylation protein Kti12